MATKILIADDEAKMLVLIRDFLIRENFEVVTASNGQIAYNMYLEDPDIDLFILDIMMPVMDGLEACQKIRETSNKPIIMLTAKTREIDELFGFSRGADEYIKKPFSPTILVARVKALLKRTVKENTIYKDDLLFVDFDTHTTMVEEQPIKLSKIEYKLLQLFVDNKNAVLSREQILDNVWGFDYEGTDRTVDTTINRLRTKLFKCGTYIKTVHGFGYSFEVKKWNQ